MKLGAFLILTALFFIGATQEVSAVEKKKIIKYRKHTKIDFSGETVEGEVRAPEIFYIFQRKRSDRQDANVTPNDLNYQKETISRNLLEGIP